VRIRPGAEQLLQLLLVLLVGRAEVTPRVDGSGGRRGRNNAGSDGMSLRVGLTSEVAGLGSRRTGRRGSLGAQRLGLLGDGGGRLRVGSLVGQVGGSVDGRSRGRLGLVEEIGCGWSVCDSHGRWPRCGSGERTPEIRRRNCIRTHF
jgi:hypothetical protein